VAPSELRKCYKQHFRTETPPLKRPAGQFFRSSGAHNKKRKGKGRERKGKRREKGLRVRRERKRKKDKEMKIGLCYPMPAVLYLYRM
jgi:hypothetical protein